MFEDVLKGKSPSAVFREVLQKNPDLYYRDMASDFYDEFLNLDSSVINCIWAWEAPGKIRKGLSDSELDEMITEFLYKANYLVRPSQGT